MAADSKDDNAQEKPEQAVVAFHYLSDKNPSNGFYPGVPPGDILKDAYDGYPQWIQNSIAASPMYKAVEAKDKKAAAAAKPSESKAEESEK